MNKLWARFRRPVRRGFLTLFLPYDLYERHAVVGRLLPGAGGDRRDSSRVLDVGGRTELLELFTLCRVISVNVDGSGDLVASGCALPFAESSFTAVVSIDTVEHVPRGSRLPFLRECFRVAQRCVVVAAPFGSEAHKAYERRLDELHQSVYGEPHIHLSEHVLYELPGTDDIDQFVCDLGVASYRRLFAGNFVWQCGQFERAILGHLRKGVLGRLRNMCHYLGSLALFHPIRLREHPDASANRFYLFIEKGIESQ